MRNNKSIDMTNRNSIILSLFALALIMAMPTEGLAQDKIPVREYTNPDEVVTFDRTTAFTRALDVINEFAQEARGKVIIDRTGQSGSIGITVPPMHWEDALDLILRVKGLVLFEREKFYEILSAQQTAATSGQQGSAQQGGEDGEGPHAEFQGSANPSSLKATNVPCRRSVSTGQHSLKTYLKTLVPLPIRSKAEVEAEAEKASFPLQLLAINLYRLIQKVHRVYRKMSLTQLSTLEKSAAAVFAYRLCSVHLKPTTSVKYWPRQRLKYLTGRKVGCRLARTSPLSKETLPVM